MKVTTRVVGNETRYFAETGDGFDGTAQGYGYRSMEKLNKAYWYFKNRNRLEGEKGSAKKLLKDNRALAKLLRDYFSADNYLYALKDGETLSVQSLIEDLKQYERPDKLELIAKLESNRPLWRALERLVGDE
ncbi:MAG: hypothetical protein KIS30_08690 [Thermoplasmata archaeon]|nr:hypothetical protein [Candidatus Sysuiplasma acidicola]MBX8646817.1 hypothetical protein [Candidatus Sysuiplasma acidicola]